MGKYDEARKGARFTMCQAALQGGADISIVPKIMEYIESGDGDILKYISPCEKVERKIQETTEQYDDLRKKLAAIEEARDELNQKRIDVQTAYEMQLREADTFICRVREARNKLQEFADIGSAQTMNSIITAFTKLDLSKSKHTYVKVGEYLLPAIGVEEVKGKVVIKTGYLAHSRSTPYFKILPDGTLSSCGSLTQAYNNIISELDKSMKTVYEVTDERPSWISQEIRSLR